MPEGTPEDLAGSMPTQEIEKLARVAFGGYLKPEQYLDSPDFLMLPEGYKQWFKPSAVEQSMFRPPANSELKVRIEPASWRSPEISLTPVDFALIGRYPDKLAESALRQTLAAGEINEERVAAAGRSRIHAVESRQVATMQQLEKMIERKAQLDDFAKQARAAGWAHLRPAQLQELFNVCSQELLTILDTLQARERWTDEERALRHEGMIYYLTQGDQRTRVNHWRTTIGMVRRYLQARIRTFENHYNGSSVWLSKQEGYDEDQQPT